MIDLFGILATPIIDKIIEASDIQTRVTLYSLSLSSRSSVLFLFSLNSIILDFDFEFNPTIKDRKDYKNNKQSIYNKIKKIQDENPEELLTKDWTQNLYSIIRMMYDEFRENDCSVCDSTCLKQAMHIFWYNIHSLFPGEAGIYLNFYDGYRKFSYKGRGMLAGISDKSITDEFFDDVTENLRYPLLASFDYKNMKPYISDYMRNAINSPNTNTRQIRIFREFLKTMDVSSVNLRRTDIIPLKIMVTRLNNTARVAVFAYFSLYNLINSGKLLKFVKSLKCIQVSDERQQRASNTLKSKMSRSNLTVMDYYDITILYTILSNSTI